MAKKEKIVLQHGLEDIDAELSAAMSALDETNLRITELLTTVELPQPGAIVDDGPEDASAAEAVPADSQPDAPTG